MTAEKLAAFGLRPSDYDNTIVEYWPDTRQAVELFLRVRTQWRIGMRGATGLDYSAIYPLMDRLRLSDDQWDSLLSDIHVMEMEALDVMHTNVDSESA